MHMLQGVKRAATVTPKHHASFPIRQETNVWHGNIGSRIENALSLASERYAKTPPENNFQRTSLAQFLNPIIFSLPVSNVPSALRHNTYRAFISGKLRKSG